MHIAAVLDTHKYTIAGLRHLLEAVQTKAEAFARIVKLGRTHMQDAVPITLGQEMSAYATVSGLSSLCMCPACPSTIAVCVRAHSPGNALLVRAAQHLPSFDGPVSIVLRGRPPLARDPALAARARRCRSATGVRHCAGRGLHAAAAPAGARRHRGRHGPQLLSLIHI